MGAIDWIKGAASDTVSFLKKTADKITDPIYVPIDELNRQLSSNTIFVTNTLSEPIYVQVVPNGDWTVADGVFLLARAALAEPSSYAQLAASAVSLGSAGLKAISGVIDMNKRDEFRNSYYKLTEQDRDKFVAELKTSMKEDSKKVDMGQTVLVQETATISLNRASPSGVSAQISSEVSNFRLVVVSESLTKAVTVNTNEDTSWIVQSSDIVKADKKDRTKKASDSPSHGLWSIV